MSRRTSRTRTIAITLGSLAAGAVIATGVSGIAMAADSSPSPSTSSSSQASGSGSTSTTPGMPGMRDGRGHGGPGRGMPGGLGGQPLHGEITVKQADGTIATVQLVQGTVTAVSSSSITVKAEDGFTATYAVNSSTDVRVGLPQRPADGSKPADGTTPPASTDTIADVKVGDVAHVEGTVSGGTATATEVHAMTAAEAAQLEADRAAHDQARQQQSRSTASSSSLAG